MTDPTTTTDNSPPRYVLQGWECPRCQRVHAPFVSTCPHCVGRDPIWPYSPVYPWVQPPITWPISPYTPIWYTTAANSRTQ